MPFDGWVEIARPAAIPITEALIGGDKELAAFWEAEKGGHRYDYVALGCSFGPVKGKPFAKAWFEVGLASAETGEGPSAWSMDPREVIDAAELTQSAKLGVKLELLSAEGQTQVKRTAKEWFLRAYRVGTAQPYWEFRSTVQSPIAGAFRHHLVVRSPVGSTVEGRITLRAIVEKRTFLIFRKEQSLDEPASVMFTLPPRG
ncbi:MAG TPA: hypothetical protein VE078_19080 [Thermoanaerobaculia bacterium]|nr:hypothetical protein [Thermoanaerobaculia bacterium]